MTGKKIECRDEQDARALYEEIDVRLGLASWLGGSFHNRDDRGNVASMTICVVGPSKRRVERSLHTLSGAKMTNWAGTGRMRTATFAVILALAGAGAPGAKAGLPAVKELQGTPISGTDADTWYNGQGTNAHTNGLCTLKSIMCGLARPAAIVALTHTLSRGGTLSSDQFATNVYEYIYKNIDTEFRYGLSKGAFGALLDQSGTPFDQAHLMGELLKEGMAEFPTAYGGLSPKYIAGTVTLDGTEFASWTGITNAQAACQFLANGGIPAAVNGPPQQCSSLSGNVTSVVMGHIWVKATTSAGTKVYDPSFKTYIQKAPIDLASAMGCGTSCGSNAVSQAIPAASQGFDSGANANYVQNVDYTDLGTTLNGYAKNLQHYIEQNAPAANVKDIAGGEMIDPTSLPVPGVHLPYDSSPTVQHTWTGDIPNQYRSRFNIQVNNINVWLYADETYGYWLYVTTALSNSDNKIYTALLFEREKGTGAPNTPNIVQYCDYQSPGCDNSGGTLGGVRATNEAVLLGSTTVTSPTSVTLQADHPYAASSTGGALDGTYADDTISPQLAYPYVTFPNASKVFGFLITGPSCYVIQSWGKTGRGLISRMSRMADDKKDLVVGAARWIQGSDLTIPNTSTGYFQDLLRNLSLPATAATWLTESGKAVSLIDGMSSTRAQEQHTIGILGDTVPGSSQSLGLTPIGATIISDAVGSVSVTSITANGTDVQSAFAADVTAYDLFEGGALEQMNDSPDGGNAVRGFELANETDAAAMKFYSANWQNLSTVLAAVNYGTGCGQIGGSAGCGSSVLQAYLYTNSPFTMIVPQTSYWWVQSPITNEVFNFTHAPLLAYSTNSAIAYLTTYGTKGAAVTSPLPDPVSATIDTTHKMEAAKPINFSADNSSGTVTASLLPDLVTGSGPFPHSLSHQLFYNSDQIANVQCNERASYPPTQFQYGNPPVTLTYTNFIAQCLNPAERRTMLGWDDNYQISANFINDGMRALGQDNALDASAALSALYVIRDLNKSPNFHNEIGMIFTAAWLQDNVGANAVVVTRPPGTDTFVRLPDGRFNPRPGAKSSMTQTGTRTKTIAGSVPIGGWVYDYYGIQLAETDGAGNVLHFSVNDGTTHNVYVPPLNRFKPDVWNFADGTNLSFNYTTTIDPLTQGHYLSTLSNVTNSFGRSLAFSGTTVTDDSQRSATVSILGPTSGQITTPDTGQTVLSFDRFDTFSAMATTRLSAIYQPLDHVHAYLTLNWDGLRRLASAVDANQNTTSYFPASAGNGEIDIAGGILDPLGDATSQYFDDRGHLLSSTDPLGNVTAYAYDGIGRLLQTTYPELNYDMFSYDVRSNLISTKHYPVPGSAEDTAHQVVSTFTTYEEAANVFSCVNPKTCNSAKNAEDARGYYTDFSWDPNSGLETQVVTGVNATGACQIPGTSVCPETDLGYQPYVGVQMLHSKTQKLSATASTETDYDYDSTKKYPLKTATVDAGTGKLNLITNFAFDATGNLTSVDGPRTDVDDRSYFQWDANRRLKMAIKPDPDGSGNQLSRATLNSYDLNGRLQETDEGTVTDAQGDGFTVYATQIFGYDAANNKVLATETAPNLTAPLNVTQFSYDADQRPLCTAVRMNPSIFGSLPSDPCALGTQGSYGPDRIGQMIYDAAGRKRQEVRALGTALQQTYETFDYTANGQLKAVADSDAGLAIGSYTLDATHTYPHQTNYAYDGFDRVNLTTFADGSFEQIPFTNGYDAAGDVLTRINRASQTLTYTYDPVGRAATKTVPAVAGVSSADTVTWGYDLLNEVTSLSDTLGNTLTNAYDNAFRLKTASRHAPGLSGTQMLTYQYDAAGNRTALVWPGNYCVAYSYDATNAATLAQEGTYSAGTCTAGATLATFGYDTLDNLADIHYGGTLADVGLTWQTNGDLLSIAHNYVSSPDVSFSDTYTPAHQITASTVTNTSYIAVPGTYANTYAPANGLNQYTAVNGGAASGHDCQGHAEQFSYDCNGNLTSDGVLSFAYDPENRLMTAATSGMSASYAYDPLGRRSAKTVNGVATYFLDSGGDEIGEYSATGTLLRRYIPGLAVDHPLAMIDYTQAGNPKTFFHQDKTGSVVAMSDTTGNVVAGPWTYDAYGNTPSPAGEPYRFDGMRLDPETNCYYDRARYYCPGIGRFLQTDPVGYADDVNWYSWAGNDPTDKSDPKGLYELSCPGDNGDCLKAADKFETERKENLQSTDPDVSAAAEAFGAPHTYNHVFVTFRPEDEIKREGGGDAGDQAVALTSGTALGEDRTPYVTVAMPIEKNHDYHESIAHEGTHVADDLKFLNSYNSATGKYDMKSPRVIDSESRAFGAGAKVNHGTPYPNVPHGMEDYIKAKYPFWARPVFPPELGYPQ